MPTLISRASGAIASLIATALWLTPGPALARIEARFAADGPLEALARTELATAKYRVDAALPDLADTALIDALVDLAEHKVEVRLLVAAGVNGAPVKCKPCDRLELHGADVRTTDTRVLHRFVVIDGPRGKKGSGVLGRLLLLDGSLTRGGSDASLITMEREGDFVLAYQNEFNFLWGKGRDYDDKARHDRVYDVTPPPAPFVLFSSANMVPLDLDGGWLLSPAASARGLFAGYLAGAIDHAYDQVLVSAPALKSLEIYQALSRALERGVMVRLLVDESQRQSTKALPNCLALPRSAYRLMDECLAMLGADVRYAAANAGVRSGLVLIDGKTLNVGNFRLSRAAEFKALGSVMTLRGEVAKSFQRHFEQTFAATRPSLAPRGPKVMTAFGTGCVGIRSAALTFEELQKWRAIYRRGMCE